MSAQLPPNPILTTYQYWNWINVDEATRRQRALDNNYMMFPTAQNYPTFFSKLFFITEATLTKMSNTSYVYSLVQALLSATTWTGSNQFHSIKVNTLANITLNNANIGYDVSMDNITLNNPTFNNPLTPTYSYPIGTAIAPNTPSIGTAGTIGFIPATTFITNQPSDGITGGAGNSMRSVDLTPGTWMLYGFARRAVNNFQASYGNAFSTAQNNVTGEIGRKGSSTIGNTSSNLVQGMSTTAIAIVSTPTTYFYNVRCFFSDNPTPIESSTLIAVRVG